MRLVSFDAFRGMGLAHGFIKPENWLSELELLRSADVLLFPASWQVNVLHHVLGKRIFPSIASYRLGWDKIEMTRAFQLAAPDALPETLILPANELAAEQALDRLGLPLVVKQPRSSMGRGVALIHGRDDLMDWVRRNEVLYAQQYLPNDGDVRVVWIGRGVAAAYWRRNGEGFLNNVSRGGVIDFERVPPAALELVQRIAPALGVDHAGFDVMLVDGHPFVLEFNVLFGNEGLNRLGIDPQPLILNYLRETCSARFDPCHVPDQRVSAPIFSPA